MLQSGVQHPVNRLKCLYVKLIDLESAITGSLEIQNINK